MRRSALLDAIDWCQRRTQCAHPMLLRLRLLLLLLLTATNLSARYDVLCIPVDHSRGGQSDAHVTDSGGDDDEDPDLRSRCGNRSSVEIEHQKINYRTRSYSQRDNRSSSSGSRVVQTVEVGIEEEEKVITVAAVVQQHHLQQHQQLLQQQ